MPDTHALYWYFDGSPKLSVKAADIFAEAVAGRAKLVISIVVLAELYFLLKKQGRESAFFTALAGIQGSAHYEIDPLTLDDIRNLPSIPDLSEMHDRLIAIHARRAGAALVTADRIMQASAHVNWVW